MDFPLEKLVDRLLDKQDKIVEELKLTRETLVEGLANIANVQENIHDLKDRVRKLEVNTRSDDKDDAALRKAKLLLYGKLGGLVTAVAALIAILVEQVR
mgnify:CR=1